MAPQEVSKRKDTPQERVEHVIGAWVCLPFAFLSIHVYGVLCVRVCVYLYMYI